MLKEKEASPFGVGPLPSTSYSCASLLQSFVDCVIKLDPDWQVRPAHLLSWASLEGLVIGLVVIYMQIAPICPS